MIAAGNGSEKSVKMLLAAGAINLSHTNKNGETALSLARKNGFSDIAVILECAQ